MKKNLFTLTETTMLITCVAGASKPQNLNINIPFSIAFNSDTAGRKIELSFDGGTVYHDMVADLNLSVSNQLVLSVLAPVSNIKVTGDIGDTVIVTEES
ncbi:MAG: hypothetical protein PHQ35_11560 [Phycisphaerae bacterium]|nr:hypothetical protein [Phycisphaerae bacterium]